MKSRRTPILPFLAALILGLPVLFSGCSSDCRSETKSLDEIKAGVVRIEKGVARLSSPGRTGRTGSSPCGSDTQRIEAVLLSDSTVSLSPPSPFVDISYSAKNRIAWINTAGLGITVDFGNLKPCPFAQCTVSCPAGPAGTTTTCPSGTISNNLPYPYRHPLQPRASLIATGFTTSTRSASCPRLTRLARSIAPTPASSSTRSPSRSSASKKRVGRRGPLSPHRHQG